MGKEYEELEKLGKAIEDKEFFELHCEYYPKIEKKYGKYRKPYYWLEQKV